MKSGEGIPTEEFGQYALQVKVLLDEICNGPSFKTSRKSCVFLRYIVHHTLNGDLDELKERVIGFNLLGREAGYDTSSDASVRVRANDVRKRLAAHNSLQPADVLFYLDLPLGSYVPRLFRTTIVQSVAPSMPEGQEAPPDESHEACFPLPSLSLWQMGAPTFAAFFLCIICLRWQIAQEHPFATFWQNIFQDHYALVYLPQSDTGAGHDLVTMQAVQNATPLLNLAGQFHAHFEITDTLPTPSLDESTLVTIGSGSRSKPLPGEKGRLVIANGPSGPEVLDSGAAGGPRPLARRAALLTIANGTRRSIRIEGTDADAIRTLIKMLCERNAFPDSLADSLRAGTVTQVVFPMSPALPAMVYRQTLQATSDGMAREP